MQKILDLVKNKKVYIPAVAVVVIATAVAAVVVKKGDSDVVELIAE